jgi:DNA polymerase V
VLAKAAADGMRCMYVPGFQLIKAGVYWMDLQSANVHQAELELDPEEGRDRTRLMAAMDALNGRFGKGTLHVGSTGLQDTTRTWGMRQERRTPQYTTRWEDVPVARA